MCELRRNSIQDIAAEQFERQLNDVPKMAVLAGNAPLCKLQANRNWIRICCFPAPTIDHNRHDLLRIEYEARIRGEMSVLVR